MKIGLVGLGKMGAQINERLLKGGHQVEVMDLNPVFVNAATELGAHSNETREEMLTNLNSPAVVWLMIPASVVQDEIESWLEILPEGSVLIDGGNSDYRLTKQRAELAKSKGVELIDVGTSGGVHGLENGFSMMIGGSSEAFAIIEPVVKSLAQLNGYKHFGPAGAGHYVKMVHNAIEYGMMESYAEGYRLLKEGPYENIDLAGVAGVWQNGSIISSNLNELTGQALQENPTLEGIDGFVAESGEARWALETAKELQIPVPSIEASFEVRLASQKGDVTFATKLLAAMRNKFGGHSINKDL